MQYAFIIDKRKNMMKRTALFAITLFTTFNVFAQTKTLDGNEKKHFIGSTVFMLGNLASDPPNYYQLNYGYRITPKDVVSIEAITWEYKGPLGRPYGENYENDSSNFPGSVKAFGLGLAYKRFIWKDLYTAFHSTVLHQKFLNPDKKKIQSGYQLFNTLRVGYQYNFLKNKYFIEPSIGLTFWPINTNLPESFQKEEDKWNNYFLFEPGLHFGVNF
jgi:hypothetical protein